MLSDVARLAAWEWNKLRRRWMPWILLAVAVVLTLLAFWFTYVAYHNESVQEFTSGGLSSFSTGVEVDGQMVEVSTTCAEIANGQMPENLHMLPEQERLRFLEDMERFRVESCTNTQGREALLEGLTLPGSLTISVNAAVDIFQILVLILAGSAMGVEYGWGTLRTVLTRGTGRWQFLASKMILTAVVVAACILVVVAAVGVSSVLAAVIPPAEDGGLVSDSPWSHVPVAFVKALYSLAPYVALGIFLAVLTQSSAMSIALSLGYYVVELIAVPILGLNETLSKVTDYVLGPSVDEWMESAALVSVSVSSNGDMPPVDEPSALRSFLVILCYAVVLGAAAFWMFQRRDITGARGG